jgi:hypothetical protein
MRLTFQHTLGDILELNRSVREQRLKAWLVIVLGMGFLLAAAWLAALRNNQPDATVVFIVAAVIILIGAFGTRVAGLGAWFLKARRSPYELEFCPDGVAFLEDRVRVLVGWEHFYRWYHTKRLLVLVTAGDALAIPKRSCGDAEWAELLAIIERYLGSPSRW